MRTSASLFLRTACLRRLRASVRAMRSHDRSVCRPRSLVRVAS
jgi:hypothetical protein